MRRAGGLDVWRLAAAIGVVLTHSYALTGHFDDRPFVHIGDWTLAFGNAGVGVFFAISGFLLARSLDRDAHPLRYLRNRAARIYPALIVCVLAIALVMGAWVTQLPQRRYVAHESTWDYIVHNTTLLFGVKHYLRGVFDNGPANASLWTLPYELWAYVALLALAMVGLVRRTLPMAALALLSLAAFRLGVDHDTIDLRRSWFGMHLWNAVELASFFLVGVVAHRISDRVRFEQLAWVGGALVAGAFALGEPTLFLPGLALLVIGTGARPMAWPERVTRFGDPSYGVYIWSYPVQQLLHHRYGVSDPLQMFAASASISLALGYLSWHAIEQPVLRLAKGRRRGQPTSATAEPPAPAPA